MFLMWQLLGALSYISNHLLWLQVTAAYFNWTQITVNTIKMTITAQTVLYNKTYHIFYNWWLLVHALCNVPILTIISSKGIKCAFRCIITSCRKYDYSLDLWIMFVYTDKQNLLDTYSCCLRPCTIYIYVLH